MLKEIASQSDVYIVTGYSDLRKGIDGLTAAVKGSLNMDPFNPALYLFCGRRRDRIKGLLWEGDGFLLLYKRLDNGVFRWPRNEYEAKKLNEQQIRWLMEGLEIDQPKAIKRSKPSVLY
ncbi:MAG: IS66 family insertion sequence element accessory protein TnpB [Clostridia bacterium]|nr:IS66 family insertion sequence element accessory protein TnpB [Clostridia bacterium]